MEIETVNAALKEALDTLDNYEALNRLTDRQRALLTAADEFVINRDITDESFAALTEHLSKPQIIEFCALAAHYDAIAAILAALRVPMDFPD